MGISIAPKKESGFVFISLNDYNSLSTANKKSGLFYMIHDLVTVTFDANGGTILGAPQKTYEMNPNIYIGSAYYGNIPSSQYTLSHIAQAGGPPVAPVRDGYVFAGWATSKTTNGFGIDKFTTPGTYYARWVPQSELGGWTFTLSTGYGLICYAMREQIAPDSNSKVVWYEVFDFTTNTVRYPLSSTIFTYPEDMSDSIVQSVYTIYVKGASGEFASANGMAMTQFSPYKDPQDGIYKFHAYDADYAYDMTTHKWTISAAKHAATVMQWSASTDATHTKTLRFGVGNGKAYLSDGTVVPVIATTEGNQNFTLPASGPQVIKFVGTWTLIRVYVNGTTGENDANNPLMYLYDYQHTSMPGSMLRYLKGVRYANFGAATSCGTYACANMQGHPLVIAPNLTQVSNYFATSSYCLELVFPKATAIASTTTLNGGTDPNVSSSVACGMFVRIGGVTTTAIASLANFPGGMGTSSNGRFYGSDGTDSYYLLPNGKYPNGIVNGNQIYLDGTWYTIPDGYYPYQKGRDYTAGTSWTDTGIITGIAKTYYVSDGWVGQLILQSGGKGASFRLYNVKTAETIENIYVSFIG